MSLKKCIILIITGSVLLLSACGKKEDKMPEIKGPTFDNSLPGEEGIKNAIRGYNQAVIDAYLSDAHVKFIHKYATEKEMKRMFVFINTDRERDLAMAMKLNKLVFDEVFASENGATVNTSENWDFHYINIKTGKPNEPVKEMRYKLQYTLEKENGKWVVAKLKEREKSMIGEYSPPRWSLTAENK